MLLILIPAAWLAVTFFALTMCRLAARSDDSRAVGLAEWIATSHLSEHQDAPVVGSAEQFPWADWQCRAPRPLAARARAISGIHVN